MTENLQVNADKARRAVIVRCCLNYKKLFLFTLPSIAMMIFTSIYGIVDGLFVSNVVAFIAAKRKKVWVLKRVRINAQRLQ